MGVSKINFGGTVQIDLTADTVDAASLLEGRTAHGADGEVVTGALTVQTYSVSGTTLVLRSAAVSGTALAL